MNRIPDTHLRATGIDRYPEVLDAMLKLGLGGAGLVVVIQIALGLQAERFISITGIFCVLGIAWWLRRRRHFQAAIKVYLIGILIAVLVQATLVGGSSTPGLMILPVMVLLAGWALHLRASLWVCLVGIGAVYLMEIARLLGFQPLAPPLDNGMQRAIVFSVVVVLGYQTMVIVIRSHEKDLLEIRDLNTRLQQQLEQIQVQEAAIRQSEAEVRILNAQLEARVARRTQELQQTLDTLHRAQEELVHSEKLAALGSLVAGVAHELNTPLGNAVTASSGLSDRVREIRLALEQGTMKKSALEDFLSKAEVGTDLVQRSLLRASSLVESFKQVAVDQVSERRRKFLLDEVIREVIDTLKPNLKLQPWKIQIAAEPGIEMDGFPGALGQVVINLVMNASMHAFEGRQSGLIVVEAHRVDLQRVALSCTDDGTGMDSLTLGRIFEPFFTTKLGQGGSGLGLAIVHRLITQVLGGTVHVESTPEAGTSFQVELPLVSPSLAV